MENNLFNMQKKMKLDFGIRVKETCFVGRD